MSNEELWKFTLNDTNTTMMLAQPDYWELNPHRLRRLSGDYHILPTLKHIPFVSDNIEGLSKCNFIVFRTRIHQEDSYLGFAVSKMYSPGWSYTAQLAHRDNKFRLVGEKILKEESYIERFNAAANQIIDYFKYASYDDIMKLVTLTIYHHSQL